MSEENRKDSSGNQHRGFGLGAYIIGGLMVYVGSYFLLRYLMSLYLTPGADVMLESDFLILLIGILELIYLPLTWIQRLLGLL